MEQQRQAARTDAPRSARIVLTTFGSLGDLHPYIALALGLKQRGHDAIIATSPFYREKVEPLGIGFRPVRPDEPDWKADPTMMARIMDARGGTRVVLCELIMPAIRDSYADTLAAAEGADLLVSHPLTYTTRLVAEKQGLRWASSMLAPLGFFSAWDPPVLPTGQFLRHLRPLGPGFHQLLFGLAKFSIRSWGRPWHDLRRELGLAPVANPFFEGSFSSHLMLALFSESLGSHQPDWPAATVVTGFPFYDRDGAGGTCAELDRFLESGSPPIVFTLGSSAVNDPGRFFEESVAAARLLGRRAVLLTGKEPQNRPATLPEGIAAFDYAPYSELFPHAAAIVHQGGVGTTAQAMRSGRPMLVMPYAHDQPDNAARVARLGIARVISRSRYTARRAALELDKLLSDEAYRRSAGIVANKIRREDGVRTACDALESLLRQG